MDTDQRFDRLESKIDKLTDAVTKIVRVEEQMISSNRRLDNVEQRVEKVEVDIDGLAKIVRENAGVARFADRLFWILLAGAVSFMFYLARF
jgi:septal ring factor EnvC (AmiA/AmiB activator)